MSSGKTLNAAKKKKKKLPSSAKKVLREHNGILVMVTDFIPERRKRNLLVKVQLKVIQVYILESRLPVQEALISSQVRLKLGFCRWLTSSWECRLQHVQVETHVDRSSDQFPVRDVDGKSWTLQEEVLSCFQDHSGEEEET